VARLENEFVMGYHDGDRALYVSPYSNLDEVLYVSDDMKASRSSLWQEANIEFDVILKNDPDIFHLVGKMFFVWKGNHRLMVWEHGNIKVTGLAGLSAKSGYFRVTLVSSKDSMKCRRLRTLRICLFSTS
jgi:hypothetical protein